MKKISLIALCILLTGCSVFKKSIKKQTKQTEQTEMRDVLTNTNEEIEITIPPALFARIYGKDIDIAERPEKKEEAKKDTAKEVSNDREEVISEPVTVTINRKTKTQDNTTIETEQEQTQTKEQITEKESKDFIGNFKWMILVGGAVVLGIAIVVIRFYF